MLPPKGVYLHISKLHSIFWASKQLWGNIYFAGDDARRLTIFIFKSYFQLKMVVVRDIVISHNTLSLTLFVSIWTLRLLLCHYRIKEIMSNYR